MFTNRLFPLLIVGVLAVSACGAPQQTQGFTPSVQSQNGVANPSTQSGGVQNSPVRNQPVTQNQTNVAQPNSGLSYPIVDTNQTTCYSDNSVIACPQEGQAFAGQDGNYQGLAPAYTDNGDGTVTDLNTGLMWLQSPDFNGDGQINAQDKMTYDNALTYADSFTFAGYDDWRLPSIKELYSLIEFTGKTGTGNPSSNSAPSDAVPFLDTRYFKFGYGDGSAGERYIDAQFASSTKYVSTTMNGMQTMFGVNFADGRIKGYGYSNGNGRNMKTFYVLYVRGNEAYGKNSFVDNGNGTITDNATGLTWLQQDSGGFKAGTKGDGSLNWQEALAWCESLDYAGASDWRLPNAKELQSLVDYTRSPKNTNSAAIDPLFQATYLPNGVNNEGQGNYPYYWSSTTHLDGPIAGARAAYLAFGEARGIMNGQLMDVHGAGAQRSDLKSGDPSQLPIAQGPQGDIQNTYDYARCVRGGQVTYVSGNVVSSSQPTISAQNIVPANQQNQQGQGRPAAGGPNGGQPPQEAINACSGQPQGSTCSVNTPNGTLNGTCLTPPKLTQLVCVPVGSQPR